jgi:hypothetical protein
MDIYFTGLAFLIILLPFVTDSAVLHPLKIYKQWSFSSSHHVLFCQARIPIKLWPEANYTT